MVSPLLPEYPLAPVSPVAPGDPVAPVAPFGPAGPGDPVAHALNASAANAAVNSFEYLMKIPSTWLTQTARVIAGNDPTSTGHQCKIEALLAV